MAYKTIRQKGEFTLVEKKSEFIASSQRIRSEKEALDIIEETKRKIPGARHHVYAYSLGENDNIVRYSDDGEPKGTGGMPVLNLIKMNGLKDCLIIVSRIFGGILLGAPGLTRAYGNAAKESLNLAKIGEVVEGSIVKMELPYELNGKLSGNYSRDKLQIIGEEYGERVALKILLKEEDKIKFIERYKDLSNGRAIFEEISKDKYFLGEDGILSKID